LKSLEFDIFIKNDQKKVFYSFLLKVFVRKHKYYHKRINKNCRVEIAYSYT